MLTNRYENLFLSLLVLSSCLLMAGVYFLPVPKPMLPVFLFFTSALVLLVAGMLIGRQGAREDNLGKLVKENDLVPGRYLFGKNPNGQIVVSTYMYAVRCTNYAPAARLFDATTSDIPVRYFRELPIGGSLLMELGSDNDWRLVQGMMA